MPGGLFSLELASIERLPLAILVLVVLESCLFLCLFFQTIRTRLELSLDTKQDDLFSDYAIAVSWLPSGNSLAHSCRHCQSCRCCGYRMVACPCLPKMPRKNQANADKQEFLAHCIGESCACFSQGTFAAFQATLCIPAFSFFLSCGHVCGIV